MKKEVKTSYAVYSALWMYAIFLVSIVLIPMFGDITVLLVLIVLVALPLPMMKLLPRDWVYGTPTHVHAEYDSGE